MTKRVDETSQSNPVTIRNISRASLSAINEKNVHFQ